MSKAKKGIGITKKLRKTLLLHSFVTMYKAFVRSHLDNGDMMYDQPNNQSLTKKINLYNTRSLEDLTTF